MPVLAKNRLRSISLLALSAFVALVIALHLVRLDVDPLRWGLSFYAVGRYSALMTTAFLLLSLAVLSVSVALRNSGLYSAAGVALLAIGAVALAGVAAFPSNTVPPASLRDVAHLVASAAFFLSFAVGTQLVSFRQANRPHKFVTVALSFGYVLSLLLTFFGPAGVHGLLQRTTVLAAVTWLGVTALFLPRSAASRFAA